MAFRGRLLEGALAHMVVRKPVMAWRDIPLEPFLEFMVIPLVRWECMGLPTPTALGSGARAWPTLVARGFTDVGPPEGSGDARRAMDRWEGLFVAVIPRQELMESTERETPTEVISMPPELVAVGCMEPLLLD